MTYPLIGNYGVNRQDVTRVEQRRASLCECARGLTQPEISRAEDFILPHRQTTDELRNGFGKGKVCDQRVDGIGIAIARAPIEHGFEGRHTGCDPSKAMGGTLVILVARRQRRAGGVTIDLRGGQIGVWRHARSNTAAMP